MNSMAYPPQGYTDEMGNHWGPPPREEKKGFSIGKVLTSVLVTVAFGAAIAMGLSYFDVFGGSAWGEWLLDKTGVPVEASEQVATTATIAAGISSASQLGITDSVADYIADLVSSGDNQDVFKAVDILSKHESISEEQAWALIQSEKIDPSHLVGLNDGVDSNGVRTYVAEGGGTITPDQDMKVNKAAGMVESLDEDLVGSFEESLPFLNLIEKNPEVLNVLEKLGPDAAKAGIGPHHLLAAMDGTTPVIDAAEIRQIINDKANVAEILKQINVTELDAAAKTFEPGLAAAAAKPSWLSGVLDTVQTRAGDMWDDLRRTIFGTNLADLPIVNPAADGGAVTVVSEMLGTAETPGAFSAEVDKAVTTLEDTIKSLKEAGVNERDTAIRHLEAKFGAFQKLDDLIKSSAGGLESEQAAHTFLTRAKDILGPLKDAPNVTVEHLKEVLNGAENKDALLKLLDASGKAVAATETGFIEGVESFNAAAQPPGWTNKEIATAAGAAAGTGAVGYWAGKVGGRGQATKDFREALEQERMMAEAGLGDYRTT